MALSGTFADPDATTPSTAAAWPAAAVLAVTLPTLIAWNVPPSPTFLNQAASYMGWGLWGLLLASAASRAPRHGPARGDAGLGGVLMAVALLAVAALVAPAWTGLPWTIALSSAGTLASGAFVLMLGAVVAQRGLAVPAFHAFALALLAAATLGTALAVVQVFVPEWSDGRWIATASDTGRAAGNLRQANHLSSLLLWGLVALVWLSGRERTGRLTAALLGTAFLGGIVLTASRTGTVGLLMLALWGLLDRRLARPSRLGLLLAPLVFLALWGAFAFFRQAQGEPLVGEGQLVRPDLSSSRFAIWGNTLALIARHPWTGVGWGDFNLAWTLTPFPDRPREFFDHAHSLLLHLGAEVGVPLTLLVAGLFVFGLWRAFVSAREAAARDDALRLALRAAFMVVLVMALHSQLEYPLWYAYFLLPTAFAWGLCLGRGPGMAGAGVQAGRAAALRTPPSSRPAATRPMWVGSALLVLGGAAALHDYLRVVPIFEPGDNPSPLVERIEHGRGSVLFGHHADYAIMTLESSTPQQVLAASRRAAHYLLDSRLMESWAKALEASGDEGHARYMAARLREFRHEGNQEFFAVCQQQAQEDRKALPPGPAVRWPTEANAATLPFQCLPPPPGIGFRDFR